ncbi:PAS domain-containing protein [uncultured Mucilaginibacter sp.]|uniref:PAS domain-containing protein n=1 Tax=uncultured Mucilaginibacter sp. TaxID=797541 RepID=UPI0026004DEF|nr:PAS domain-containing protein [uncultured Mucilaginibacter sp.]
MSDSTIFLHGGGQTGKLLRSTDWSNHPLGMPDAWPESLKQAISISLNSGFPIAIYWGPQYILLYNDAYSSIPGDKHPWTLGKPGAVAWAEIWDGLNSEFEGVLYQGQSIRKPDALLLMRRYGYTEECYFDYTLSPIINKDGVVEGVFNAVIETTYKVINDRRNKILQSLQHAVNSAHSVQESLAIIQQILATCSSDIPFYKLQLSGNINVPEAGQTVVSTNLPLNQHIFDAAVKKVMVSSSPEHIENLDELAEPVTSEWNETCREAYVVSISGGEANVKGSLVLGVSPRKKLDNDYEHFLASVGNYAGIILNNGYNFSLSTALQREQALNEELAATNEELGATNDELHKSQQNLADLNNELEDRISSRTQALTESESRFRQLVEQSAVAMLVLRGPQLLFDIFNQPMLDMIDRTADVKGKPLLEVIPELIGQPIVDKLNEVLKTGIEWKGHEQPVVLKRNGQQSRGFFNVSYRPLYENGEIKGIVQSAVDVTAQVEARKAIEQSEHSLRNLVMSAHYALMILRGRDWVIDVANQQLVKLWGKSIEEVTGKRLLDVLPELEGQPFPGLLTRVYNTGTSYGQEEEAFLLDTPKGAVKKYVSFYYDPVFDADGNVTGIIVAAEDITETVENRLLLEKSYSEQQSLNEELTATNEEVAAANEELVTTNEELAHTQESLQRTVAQLAESEARIRYMVADAPVAIGIITGQDLIVEAANNKLLEVWGKDKAILNLPLHIALPELEGQAYIGLLQNVYESGVPYSGDEAKVLLVRGGVLEECYFNYVYHPIKDNNGNTFSIMVVANEITEQVRARNTVEQAEEMLRLSIEAARVGTWYLDINSREFRVSGRMKELFGFYADDVVDYADAVNCIPDEHRALVEKAVAKAIADGEVYNIEHPVIGHHDKKIRWIRASGRLNDDNKSGVTYFSGVIIDITEQKQDEQRKNDFIGMVSHELKTPLTSLSAYVQMLHAKARNSSDSFTTNALDKVSIQVRKMTTMINGFLNVSRLESGKIHLDKQIFDLATLVHDMVEETQLTTSSHSISLHQCDSHNVNADREKIGTVISNLLSNAIKYSPRNTHIKVGCEILDGVIRVSVKDQGIGIKMQDLEKLFERYYRVDNNQTQTISGFGIGLYLCAEIVNRHDGKIWAESEAGAGSTFYFSLPLA